MATTPDAPLRSAAAAAGATPLFRQRIEEGLARLSNQQKIALMVALAMIAVLVVGSFIYSRQPDYKVLFSNISEQDGGAIITALEQMNVPYKFSESGGALLVPYDKVHEARLRLATQGLPKGGTVGFELMENQKFGITQFAEQVNYQRALEGELSRTIQTVAAVQVARVHLAIPKPSVFVREEVKPSASVMLHLYPGRQLEPQQIAGITHLVASSIPQMPAGNITIVDQTGNLLSRLKTPLTEAGLDATQLKYIREVEASVIKRVEDILLPITGPANLRVQVSADIDFSQTEQTAETFRPNTDPQNATIRSQQSNENVGGSANPSGVPGALSNQPPVPATAPLTTPAAPGTPAATSANTPGRVVNAGVNAQITSVGQPINAQKGSTTNYEVDKTITHTKTQLGRVKRLSVAVVVNNKADKDKSGKPTLRTLTDPEIKQLSDLAKEAMGFSPPRGDSLLVVNSSFSPLPEEAALEFWKQPGFWDFAKDLAKYLVIGAFVLYILLAVVRPILRQMFPGGLAPEARPGDTLSTTDEGGPEIETEDEEELNLAYATYEKKLERAKKIAIEDPKAVANIMKEWISPNG